MSLNDIGVVLPVVVVEVLEEFLLADDLAWVVQKVLEDVVFGRREIDEESAAMDSLLKAVEFYAERLERGVGSALSPADECLGSGNELSEIEGFGEVVVCTVIQELDDGFLAFLRGKDEDGCGIVTGAHAAKQALTVEFGEHEVEDDEVVTEVTGCIVSRFAVLSPIDCEAGAVAQGCGEILSETDLIFDQQHAHWGLSHCNYGRNKIKWG